MQVSPVDIQAWASETGADYPSTPAEKAAVLPAVAAWKREQLEDARAARGDNALATPLMVLGGVGLGLGGLALYHHLRKQGHSEQAAAQIATEAEAAAAAPPRSGPSAPPADADAPDPVGPRAKGPAPAGAVAQTPAQPAADYANPWDAPFVPQAQQRSTPAAAPQQLALPPSQAFLDAYTASQTASQPRSDSRRRRKGDRPAALMGANRSGTLEARARGEYSRTLWNDPEIGPQLAAATTPELQDALLTRLHAQDPALAQEVAQALDDRSGAYSTVTVKTIDDLPPPGQAKDGTVFHVANTGDVLVANSSPSRRDPNAPKGYQQGSASGVRYRLAPDGITAYGSTTAAENEKLQQTRRTGAGMFQPDYYLEKNYTYDDGRPIYDEELGNLRIETNDTALDAKMRSRAEEHLYNDRLRALRKQNPTATQEQLDAALNLAGGSRIRDININSNAPENLWTRRKPLRNANGSVHRDEEGRVLYEFRKGRKVYEVPLPSDNVNLSEVLFDKEDQDTKGLMEPLPASRSTYKGGYDIDKPSFVRVGNTLQPLEFEEIEQNYTKPDGSVGVRPVRFVKGIFVEEPVTEFVPNGKTKTRWNPSTESYEQVATGHHQIVVGQDGKPIFKRRPAQYRDLFIYHSSEFTDAPPYQGKPATEAASAMPALPFDYSRAGRRIVTRDGRKLDVAPFTQNRFILHEADDSLSKALAAGRAIDNGMPVAEALSSWGVDGAMVQRARQWQAGALEEGSRRVGPFVGTESVGGRTSRDWLTQVLSAMQGEARPGAHKLALLEHGGTYEDSAELARGWLNANSGIAEVLSSNLGGISVQEQLNVVQEALGDAARDYPKAIQWAQQASPELAERARLGGSSAFGFEHFQKSYVRKAVLGAAAELANAGGGQAASITLPAAVSEVLMDDARQLNPDRPDIQAAINARISGTTTPVEALWKLDGILSDAASDNLDESYTAGSKLAEQFFKAAQAGDGTRAGAMKARFGARSSSDYNSAVAPAPGEQIGSKLPIAINFGTNIGGAEGGNFNRNDQNNIADEINRAVNGSGLTTWKDESVINPSLPKTKKRSSVLSNATGGRARAFAVNSILDNEVKTLTGQRYALRDSYEAGAISDDDYKTQEAEINTKINTVIARQQRFDKERAANELLVADANTQAQTDRGPEGRGYVLDLGENGVVRALPDSGATVMSYDQLFQRSDNESDDYFDAQHLAESRRDAGSSGNAEAQFHDVNGKLHEPVYTSPGSAVLAELNAAEREGPLSDAEAAGPLQHLRYNQAIGRLQRQAQAAAAAEAQQLPPAAPRPTADPYTGEGPIGEIQRDVAAQLFPTPEQRAARSQAVRTAQAYRPMANTLAPSAAAESSVADPEAVARASHIGDYMDRLAAGGFRTSGDGKRLIFKNQSQVGPYTPPGDALIRAITVALPKRLAAREAAMRAQGLI